MQELAEPGSIEALVEASGLFEPEWYLAQYPELAALPIKPLRHYLAQGAGEGRDPNGFFSTTWYLDTYPDVARSRINPLAHYLLHGAAEGRDPHPAFSTSWYLGKYPDVVESGLTPLAHFLRVGQPQGRTASPRAGAAFLEAQLQAVHEWEPELDALAEPGRIYTLRYSAPPTHTPLRRAVSSFLDSLDVAYDRLVLVPSAAATPAVAKARHLLRAAQETHGVDTVALLALDAAGVSIGERPSGSREHAIPGLPELTIEERVLFLSAIVTALQPKVLVNVESMSAWQAFQRFGRGFSSIGRLLAVAADARVDAAGQVCGYLRSFLRPTIDVLDRVYVGSEWAVNALDAQFALLPRQRSKLACLYEPGDAGSPMSAPAAAPGMLERAVLWSNAGGDAASFEMAARVAARMPAVEFFIAGAGVPSKDETVPIFATPNIRNLDAVEPVNGARRQYAAVVQASPSAAAPDAIVAAALSGTPIVALDGTALSELLSDERGWLVRDADSPDAYVAQIERLLEQPNEARRRADAALVHARSRHSWDAYRERLVQDGMFL